eukprot:7214262-Pyramimonas_sp.AAC.1
MILASGLKAGSSSQSWGTLARQMRGFICVNDVWKTEPAMRSTAVRPCESEVALFFLSAYSSRARTLSVHAH